MSAGGIKHDDDGDTHDSTAMMDVRKTFAFLFKIAIGVVLLMIVATITTLIGVAVSGIALLEKALVIRLVQVTFGMVLGASCIFLGTVLSWLGISAAFSMQANSEHSISKWGVSLTTTSPGIVLVIVGALLIGVSLYKEVYYEGRLSEPTESIAHSDAIK